MESLKNNRPTLPPFFVFYFHAMTAGPEKTYFGFALILEEYPVLLLHSFSRSARKQAIDLQLYVPGNFNFTATNQRSKLCRSEIGVAQHD
jgi:hypothetical protein